MARLSQRLTIGVCSVALLSAQQRPGLVEAEAIDNRIKQLGEMPDSKRAPAIKELASEIRQQPSKYALPLAFNLAVDGTEGSDADTLQQITTTLGEVLRTLPPAETRYTDGFQALAELIRYEGTSYPENDARLKAATQKLESSDKRRAASDFTLSDLEGRKWNLKSLRGKVVLLSFWATWCPPCQREIPDLNAMYSRFQSQGFIVLSISDEDSTTQQRFLQQHKVIYPMLIDTGDRTRQQFLVQGIPKHFVFDRTGALVAQSIARPNLEGFRKMLARAGL